MYIKTLIISSKNQEIRRLEFKLGLNLIIDKTSPEDSTETGNSVGKTTVLKLIDMCLGGKPQNIYTDIENKSKKYEEIKNFLIDEEVLITLILKEDLSMQLSKEVIIERNFLQGKKAIRRVNGEQILEKDFEVELQKVIFFNRNDNKPSFRQIISHNIRYSDTSINNTIKTLHTYTTDIEYETLYLYLLGCDFREGEKKQQLSTQLKQEENFKRRLEKNRTKREYETILDRINHEIDELSKQKEKFSSTEDLQQIVNERNDIQQEISRESSMLSKLNIKYNLIIDTETSLKQQKSDFMQSQLKKLYDDVILNVQNIQKTFDDLVIYHNKMVDEKMKFITNELPTIEENIKSTKNKLDDLIIKDKQLSEKLSQSTILSALENIIIKLNEQYRQKGECEATLSKLQDVEMEIQNLTQQISQIDEYLFAGNFSDKLTLQVNEFNKFFGNISQQLYDETYLLKYDIIEKDNKQIYKFNTFNIHNMGSGKKQGEILAFDLAYMAFADSQNIPCLHFLLNDKKELLHDNQLSTASTIVKDQKVQLILSMIEVKVPSRVRDQAYEVVALSQNDKLFKVEI